MTEIVPRSTGDARMCPRAASSTSRATGTMPTSMTASADPAGAISPVRYRARVGLNPFRSRVERRTDVVVVAVAFVVIAALVVWGLFGG